MQGKRAFGQGKNAENMALKRKDRCQMPKLTIFLMLATVIIFLGLSTYAALPEGEIKEAHLHKVNPYDKSYYCEVVKKEYWKGEKCGKIISEKEYTTELEEYVKSLETRVKMLEDRIDAAKKKVKSMWWWK